MLSWPAWRLGAAIEALRHHRRVEAELMSEAAPTAEAMLGVILTRAAAGLMGGLGG